jgi:hypothetical protein
MRPGLPAGSAQTGKGLMAPISLGDLQIAATALAAGCILVTGNTRHFTDIPGLGQEIRLVYLWALPTKSKKGRPGFTSKAAVQFYNYLSGFPA